MPDEPLPQRATTCCDRFPRVVLVQGAASGALASHAAVGVLGHHAFSRRLAGYLRGISRFDDPVIHAIALEVGSDESWPQWPTEDAAADRGRGGELDGGVAQEFFSAGARMLSGWNRLVWPFKLLFDQQLGWSGLAYVLLCGLWGLAVWSFVGGAMTRNAALRLTRGEFGAWGNVSKFARSKWPSYFTARCFRCWVCFY